MPVYSILQADHPDWSPHPDYREFMGRLIRRAYRHMKLGGRSRDSYRHAYDIISPYQTSPMSPFHRQRLFYIRALKHSADSDYRIALRWLDQVIEMATKLPTGDLAMLFYLHGGLNRTRAHFRDAAADHQLALAFLFDTDNAVIPYDPSFEVSVLGELASFEYLLGQFTHAEHLLEKARALIPPGTPPSLGAATVDWIDANLSRLSRKTDRAIATSTRAAAIYADMGAANSASRIQNVAADALLDRAETLPSQGTEYNRVLREAGKHVRTAKALAEQSKERTSIALAQLTRVRYQRMRGIATDRIRAIEEAWAEARDLDDDVLLAQCMTSLADDLAASGRTDAALAHYRDVLGILDGSEMPAVGYPALRALLIADEMAC